MGHMSWQELEQQHLAAMTEVSVGSLWPTENTSNAHEVIGHCIIEATDEVGVLHRALDIVSPTFVTPLASQLNTSHFTNLDLGELATQCRLASLKVANDSRWEHTKTRGVYQVIGRCVMNAQQSPETGILYKGKACPHIIFARTLSSWLGYVNLAGKQALRYQELI